MKKLVSMLLALALVLSFAAPAFAATLEAAGETDQAQVKATFVPGLDGGDVYSVEISWENLEFTYNGEAKGTWDPTSHAYLDTKPAAWAEGKGSITVTNHSNVGIKVNLAYTAAEGYEAVSMVYDNNDFNVASADNGANGAAGAPRSFTAMAWPTGVLPATATSETVIGTITITIS